MSVVGAIRLGVIAALTLFMLSVALPDEAAAQNFPGGSWRQTCRNAQMHGGNRMSADCQMRNGNWNNSRIDLDNCRGSGLANINGQLVCEGQQGGVQGGNLPGGSWRLTCRNAQMEQGNKLRADCQRRNGSFRTTRIDLDGCRGGGVANIDGDLQCEGQGQHGGQMGGGNQGGGKWWGQGLPAGSYQRTCRNAQIQGRDLLIAQCQRQNGNWRNTRLDIDDCRGRDIANDNGHLECGGKTFGGNYGYQMPGGTWQQTCRNARIVRDDLYAECRQRDGDWVRANLDLDDCRGQQVHNDNGRLVCGGMRGQGQGGGQMHGGGNWPAGTWQQTCRNPRFDGGRFRADCREHNGNYRTDGIDLGDCHGRPVHNDNGHLRC